MNELLARFYSLFVVPGPARRDSRSGAIVMPTVVVICGPQDAVPLGSATALELARAHGVDHALVCLWRAHEAAFALRAPALQSARRSAQAMAARGLAADASGRLARVTLPDDAGEAVAHAARAAAAIRAPVAVALAGPRCDAIDRFAAAADALVIAAGGAESELIFLAEAGLGALDVPLLRCVARPDAAARLLAGAGVAAVPRLRAALYELREVRA